MPLTIVKESYAQVKILKSLVFLIEGMLLFLHPESFEKENKTVINEDCQQYSTIPHCHDNMADQ